MVAFPFEVGNAEGDEVLLVRHVTLRVVQHLAFEEAHGVVVADRAFEQALGVVRRAWRDNLQARNMGQPRFERLRVLRGQLQRGAVRSTKDDRHVVLPATHIQHLRRRV